jgi:hypothetical protein
MVFAETFNGTRVMVSRVRDCEPNTGGYYCTIEKADSEAWLDDFCIHSEDCDCSDDEDVERYIRDYISQIESY